MLVRATADLPGLDPIIVFYHICNFDRRLKSRRAAAGRAELLANFLGGAVWGVFRENANCGDPPG